MTSHIKTTHGSIILTGTLLLALFLISHSKAELSRITAFVPVSTQTAATGDVTDGLVAHWTFDGNTNDSTGSNNGTASGNPAYEEGKIGQALKFNGSNQVVDSGDIDALDGLSTITVSIWAKIDANLSQTFISKNRPGFGSWELGWSPASRKFTTRIFNDTGSNASAGTDVYSAGNNPGIDGEWHQVAFTFDGSSIQIYVDGVKNGPSTSLSGILKNTAYPVVIGGEYNNSVGSYTHLFSGLLDDVRIYNRVLSAGEISDLFNLGGGHTAPDDTTSTNPPSDTPDAPDSTSGTNRIRTTAPSPVSWKAPIGIPEPAFGIRETHFMYQLQNGETCSTNPEKCYDFGNGLEPYHDAGAGPYTHYVDPSSSHATDSGNPYGSPEKPRKTLPRPTGDGAVIEIHGDISKINAGHYTFTGGGSVSRPMFFRGASATNRPTYSDLNFYVAGSYIVIENIEFIHTAPSARPGFLTSNTLVPVHHVSFRHNLVHGDPFKGLGASSYVAENPVHDFVFYDNEVYMDGYNPHVPHPEDDRAAVGISANSHHVWIVDNDLHNIPGDSVGAGHGANYTAHDYYIGRNLMHDTGENGVDLKEVENIVVSQNKMYNFWGASSGAGGSGSATVVHYGPTYSPKNVWFLFNEIYNETGSAFAAGGDQQYDVYYIGNVAHNIHNDTGSAWAYKTWSSRGIYMVNNTFYDVDNGMSSKVDGTGSFFYLVNNIIVADGSPLEMSGSSLKNAKDIGTMKNNVFASGSGPVKINGMTLSQFKALSPLICPGCIELDPQLKNISADDAHLRAASPAIDAGNNEFINNLVSKFKSFYGLDIRRDIDNNSRPQGSAWDIGAYEFKGTNGAENNTNDTDNTNTDISAPVISFITSTKTPTTATITWTTSEPATTQVQYGLTTAYGNTTALNSSKTTSHTVSLSNLAPNTVYHYRVLSKDAEGNGVTSGDYTFTTAYDTNIAGDNTNDTNNTNTNDTNTALDANSTRSNANDTNISAGAGSPAFTRYLTIGSTGSDVLNLQKTLNALGYQVSVTGAGSPGQETTYYGPATTAALQKFQCATLKICSGTPSTNGYGNFGPQTRAALNTRIAGNMSQVTSGTAASSVPPATSSSVTSWLVLGVDSPQVRTLQQLLNSRGYTVATTGPGSPGQETTYFGNLTEAAVKRFQCVTLQVCSGTPATTGYGATGPRTRAALQNF